MVCATGGTACGGFAMNVWPGLETSLGGTALLDGTCGGFDSKLRLDDVAMGGRESAGAVVV